jgi:DNA-3-methyladenine glycosylase II
MKVTDKIYLILSKDPVMKDLIKKYDLYEWPLSEGDVYIDLVEAIVGQQLSVKAADSILKRFKTLFEEEKIAAEKIVLLNEQIIRNVGLSKSKVLYIKELSQLVVDKRVDLQALSKKSDHEIAEELLKIKGVGPWTIDMILIFTLHREDIFPIGDLGIRTAISNLYNVDRDDHEKLIAIAKNWQPYRSYACRYLWKYLDNS